jgi:hypothetical protein
MGSYPVASHCPHCGGKDFKRVKPEGRVAFTDDRKCTACGTRYTPPTPAWAAVVFILLGILLSALGAAMAGSCLFRKDEFTLRPVVYGSIRTVFGLSCITYGIRSLRGRTVSVHAGPSSGSEGGS